MWTSTHLILLEHFLQVILSEIQTPIPIINDDIDEVNQFFVVRLELVSATNPERVNIESRPFCQCEIADEDSK